MSSGGSNKKVANSLVALSSAAVLSVYGAGYQRTRAAADRVAQQETERRAHARAPRREVEPRPAATTPAASVAPSVTAADVPASVTPPPSPTPAAPATPSSLAASPGPSPAASEKAARAPIAETRTETPQPPTVAASPAEPLSTAAEDTIAPPAPAALAPSPAQSPDKARYHDGTYFGWGTSRHGDIQAAVLIEEGRIVSATVAQCLTRYSCAWIAPLPPRIVRDQGTTYDYVSGATESSDAFQDAVADALTHAQ